VQLVGTVLPLLDDSMRFLGFCAHSRAALTAENLFLRTLVEQDIPVNHSEFFAPVIEPTLSTGTQALVVAALTYLAK
jgi:hypothetical protein